jgi:regulator of replication initiation timing
MNPSKTSSLETEVSELKALVNNLLDKLENQDAQISKLTTENSALREEVRHLRKLKGATQNSPE